MRTKTMVDLRRDLTAVVRAVERGETVMITDRDRPVALMTPVPGAQWPDPQEVAQMVQQMDQDAREGVADAGVADQANTL